MKIGSAWKKNKDGKSFISGVIEWPGIKLQFAIFPVREKKGDNSPDYDVVWSNLPPKDGSSSPARREFEDDIPF